ncbi:hypothetical protein JKP88DRAFT_246072 [Tribonema minus]|uniref:RGS domain-containing protein n=1 Tax=Tribonema minus TaxID=303371 RepID=A0A836CE15_9STRA|nr:hypothetical protein JKP88DRAFT_246072 [Tribonema minus]
MVRTDTALAIAAACIANAVALVGMASMWSRRRDMMVRARSPALAMVECLSMLAMADVMGVQEMMRMEGKHMPCWLMVWAVYLSANGIIMGIVLRGMRVLVMMSKEWRDKFGLILDGRAQAAVIIGSVSGLAAMAGILQSTKHASSEGYCIGHYPWAFWVGVLLSITPPYMWLIKRLAEAQDNIGMGNEIGRALAAFYVFAGPYFILEALMFNDIIPFDTRIHILLMVCFFSIIVDVNYYSRRYWDPASTSKPKQQGRWRFNRSVRTAVAYLEDAVSTYSKQWKTSIDMIQVPALNVAFAAHVERCLCYESYKFLAESMAYTSSAFEDPEEQYAAFEKVVATCIAVNSTFEIMKYRDETIFILLEPEARRTIFKEAAAEVARMLDQNLIASFVGTKQYIAACEEEVRRSSSASASATV